MKLYVVKNNRKVYLKTKARTKKDLYRKLGRNYFYLRRNRFYVKDVKAEKENSDTLAGVLIGGLIGVVGGPWGVITGSTIGGLIANTNETEEQKKVATFNDSQI